MCFNAGRAAHGGQRNVKFGAPRIALASLLAAALAGGCATGPGSEEFGAVRAGEAAIVLLRVTGVDTSIPDAPLRADAVAWEIGGPAPRDPPLAGYTGPFPYAYTTPFPRGGYDGRVPHGGYRAPSVESRENGWRYLVLPAGSYRVFIGTSTAGSGLRPTVDAPGRYLSFWLNVPRGRPLLYAGSIELGCSTAWEGDFRRACPDVAVADETDSARAIAGGAFAGFGPLATAFVEYVHGDPIAPALLRGLEPVALATRGGGELVTPDWKARAALVWLAPRLFLEDHELAQGVELTAIRLAAALAGHAYLPVGAALASAEASAAESEWGPCMEDLAGALGEFGLGDDLERRLRAALHARGFGGAPGPAEGGDASASSDPDGAGGVLRTDIQRVQLRECEERGTFCVEVAARVRLLDAAAGEPVYDTILAYANPSRGLAPSEIGLHLTEFVVGPSQSRELAAFCGDGGRALFNGELTRALEVLVDGIVPDGRSAGG